MYSRFQLAKKYFHHYLSASNSKGHGVHSPFVFDFIANVLNDKKEYDCYGPIESIRKQLLKDNQRIEVEDFGAGSLVMKTSQRKIKDIARSSLKPKKFSQLLFRIAHYYKPAVILELGTSLGITTAYLASGNKNAMIYTCEGSGNIARVAQHNFSITELKNIEQVGGNFDESLPALLTKQNRIDLAFIDGNHRKAPTLDYFQQLLMHAHTDTILVFDDIHWSEEMEDAWKSIREHPAVTLTIDLFFIGIVLLKNNFKVKQHFTIRY